jgi:hypothetical protein
MIFCVLRLACALSLLAVTAKAQNFNPCVCKFTSMDHYPKPFYPALIDGHYLDGYGTGLAIDEGSSVASSCPPISESVGGISLANCSMNDLFWECGSSANPPGWLPPGPNSAVVNCSGTQCTGVDSNNQPICAPVSGSDSISFIVDSVPPNVVITSAPANNTIVGIQAPVVLTGTLTSISPSTVTLDSFFLDSPTSFVNSGSPGSISGSWELDIGTDTLKALSSDSNFTDNTGLTTIGLFAYDIEGNEVAISSAHLVSGVPGNRVDPSLASQVYIDSAPPTVTF